MAEKTLKAFFKENVIKKAPVQCELADLYSAVSQASDFEAGMGDKIKTVKNS